MLWVSLDLSRFVGFTCARIWRLCIHLCAPWVSLGSSGVVGFTRCNLCDVGLIRGRWVHSGVPWVLLGSFWVVSFSRACPGSRWAFPGSLGSLGCALKVFLLVWGAWIHLGASWGSLHPLLCSLGCLLGVFGFIPCRCVHSVAP